MVAEDPVKNIPKLLGWIDAYDRHNTLLPQRSAVRKVIGDIEACAFIHYSDSKIREKTPLEAYQSPLFKAYHDNQPFNCNHLRPCPVLDNEGALAGMVDATDAHSTDLENPEDVHDLSSKALGECSRRALGRLRQGRSTIPNRRQSPRR